MVIDINSKIGIFDSGIGGATVLREIVKVLPNENYIYYSDSKNNPYGDKTDKEIIEISDKIVGDLIAMGCKAIVIGCNTASAIAKEFLRNKYSDIPIIAIEPAYKMVSDYARNEPTLVLATKATIESEKFNKLYDKYNNHNTYLKACSGLADIIENGSKVDVENYLSENLQEYIGKVKNVVLGCTHYVLIKEELRKTLGDIVFFDGSKGVAKNLKEILKKFNLLSSNTLKGSVEFIDTSTNDEQVVYKKERFYEYLKKS